MINKFSGSTCWLSNFERIEFTYEGIIWKSTEQAYQALKAKYTSDFLKIVNCNTPAQAKNLGQKVIIRPDWEQIKLRILYEVNLLKFSNPRLKKLLLNTDNETLIEGNTWGDTFWGVCNSKGRNELGKILMTIREELR